MEAIKELLAGAEASFSSILAICGSIAGVWALIHKVKKKDPESASQTPARLVQGSLVPSSSQDQFEIMTLGILTKRIEQLEHDLGNAHNALRSNGIPIP